MLGFTVAELHQIRTCLGLDFQRGTKDVLVSVILEFLTLLEDHERFLEWFASLPGYLVQAIETACFAGYVAADRVEELAKQPVAELVRSSYFSRYQINPDLRLGIFDLYRKYGLTLLIMKPVFRRTLGLQLPPPEGYRIAPCPEAESQPWSAAETVLESMPLLLKSIRALVADLFSLEKILRRGLNKGEIRELRTRSAFPSFPVGAKTGVDPVGLVVRFLAIDPDQLDGADRTDVRDFIKGLVTTFLVVPSSGRITSAYLSIDSSFEYSVLCPQVTKCPGPRLRRSCFHHHPVTRQVVHSFLSAAAVSGGWYDMDEASESLRMQALSFSIFNDGHDSSRLMVKGEELVLPEGTISTDDWQSGFEPDSYLVHTLMNRPLLKGYCYLLASLGLLEIQERDPEKLLKRNGKLVPVSPFDGLSRVRVTPFGAWCLGVSEAKPELQPVLYEAIAHRELPLVTYRGRSLECRVFLEQIGSAIGEARFRITEASFIRDCTTTEEIDHRIAEFHRLIDGDPPGHWAELFALIRSRARLFEHQEPCVMIQLPDDPALRRLFLEEKRLSSLVVRAEGGRVVVTEENYRKLRKALEEFGVLKG